MRQHGFPNERELCRGVTGQMSPIVDPPDHYSTDQDGRSWRQNGRIPQMPLPLQIDTTVPNPLATCSPPPHPGPGARGGGTWTSERDLH
jgi:hypothetical protein